MITAELVGDVGELEQVLAGVPNSLQSAARTIAETIANRAPKRTGRLAASFAVAGDTPSIVSTAPYAGVVNAGWRARGIAPRRYIPTYDEMAQVMIDRAVQDLKESK